VREAAVRSESKRVRPVFFRRLSTVRRAPRIKSPQEPRHAKPRSSTQPSGGGGSASLESFDTFDIRPFDLGTTDSLGFRSS
jgi:hypothetical protein